MGYQVEFYSALLSLTRPSESRHQRVLSAAALRRWAHSPAHPRRAPGTPRSEDRRRVLVRRGCGRLRREALLKAGGTGKVVADAPALEWFGEGGRGPDGHAATKDCAVGTAFFGDSGQRFAGMRAMTSKQGGHRHALTGARRPGLCTFPDRGWDVMRKVLVEEQRLAVVVRST